MTNLNPYDRQREDLISPTLHSHQIQIPSRMNFPNGHQFKPNPQTQHLNSTLHSHSQMSIQHTFHTIPLATTSNDSDSSSSSEESDDDSDSDDDQDEDIDDEKGIHTNVSMELTVEATPPKSSFIHPRTQSIQPPSSESRNIIPDLVHHEDSIHHPQQRKPNKRSAKEISQSINEPSSPTKRQPLKSEPDLSMQPDNRPRQAPVSSSSPSGHRSQPPSASPVSFIRPTTTPASSGTQSGPDTISKSSKKRRVSSATGSNVEGKNTPPRGRGDRSTNTIALPFGAIHPPSTSESISDMFTTGEAIDPLGFNFATALESEGSSIRSIVTQLCSRASRRSRDLDTLKYMIDQNEILKDNCSNEISIPQEGKVLQRVESEKKTVDCTVNQVSSPVNQASKSKFFDIEHFHLTRLCEISEREIRLAALQQYCFRILRNFNLCFPLWANRCGSYLWHSALMLGSVSLRDMAPYCVVFEEVWDDVQIRYAEALRQAAEQRQSTNNKTQEGAAFTISDVPKPKELNGALLTAVMFQGDSVTYTNCLAQLDNIRHRIDSEFEPMSDFQEVIAAFSAAQTLHSQHQPAAKFVLAPMTRFRSAADINAGTGRGGKRKAALAALLGGGTGSTSTSQPGAGRGRTKKSAARTNAPSIQVSGESEMGAVSEAPAPRGKQVNQSIKQTSSTLNNTHDGFQHKDYEHSATPDSQRTTATDNLDSSIVATQQKKGFNRSAELSPDNQYYHNTDDDWDDGSDNDHSSTDSGPTTCASSPSVPALSVHHQFDTSTTQLSPLRSLSLPTPVHHSNLCSPPSSPILPSPFPTTSPYPYAVPDITTIPGTSQRLRQPPMLSSFIPTSFLTPTETAAVAMYPSVNTSSSGMSAITGSPRIQPALPTGSHLLPSSLHLPTAVPSPITVQPAPSISSHSTNISPASNLPPDAFELPRDPELFRSQVKGVYYDDTSNRWCASWHERKTGKKRSRYFAVKKFGFSQAKTNAMDARLEAEESGECAPTNIN